MRTTGLTTNNVFLTLPLAGGAFGFVGTGSSWIGFTGTGFSGSLKNIYTGTEPRSLSLQADSLPFELSENPYKHIHKGKEK